MLNETNNPGKLIRDILNQIAGTVEQTRVTAKQVPSAFQSSEL